MPSLTLNQIPLLIAVLAAATAMVTDMRSGRIPNWLTFPAMLAGLAGNAWLHGWSGLGYSLLACLLGHLLYAVFALFGIVGMGDVKLMGALGALGGSSFILGVFLYTSLLGIPHAMLIQWLNHGREGLQLLLISFKTGSFRGKTIQTENQSEGEPRYRFFLGLDILLGTILSLVVPLNIHW